VKAGNGLPRFFLSNWPGRHLQFVLDSLGAHNRRPQRSKQAAVARRSCRRAPAQDGQGLFQRPRKMISQNRAAPASGMEVPFRAPNNKSPPPPQMFPARAQLCPRPIKTQDFPAPPPSPRFIMTHFGRLIFRPARMTARKVHESTAIPQRFFFLTRLSALQRPKSLKSILVTRFGIPFHAKKKKSVVLAQGAFFAE